MTRDVRAGRRKLLSGAGAVTLALALAACSSPGCTSASSGSSSSGGGGLPDTIKIMDINGLTGPVAFAGSNAAKGTALAVEQIEADGLLGKSKLEIDSKDAAADPQQAASFASQAIADPSYAAILGPSASAQSAAVSPIVQAAGMPTVYVQSGQRGRHRRRRHLPAHPAGRLVLRHRGRLHRPEAHQDGVGPLQRRQPHPRPAGPDHRAGAAQGQERRDGRDGQRRGDRAGLHDVGVPDRRPEARRRLPAAHRPQYPVAISRLKQAGFQGEIIGFSAMGAANWQLGRATYCRRRRVADQLHRHADRRQLQEVRRGVPEEVQSSRRATTPRRPTTACRFLARAIAEADSADRSAIKDGLATVADKGFDGAQGHVTFDKGDARVPGVLVSWTARRRSWSAVPDRCRAGRRRTTAAPRPLAPAHGEDRRTWHKTCSTP